MTVRDLKRVLEGLDEDMQVITEVEENLAGVSSFYKKTCMSGWMIALRS